MSEQESKQKDPLLLSRVYLVVCLDLFSVRSHTRPSPLTKFGRKRLADMPLLALGHQMALSLLALMLGRALAIKPRATKRDATAMIRSLGFGLDRNAEPQPVDSEAVKLIKRGPEYGHLTRHFSGVSDAIDEALVALEHQKTFF